MTSAEPPQVRPHGADDVGPVPRVVALDIGEVMIDETRVWSIWADLVGVSPLTFAAVLGAAIVQGQSVTEAFAHVAPNVDWRALADEHERRYEGFREQDLYADVRPCCDELAALGFTVVFAGNQPHQRAAQLDALGLPHDGLATSDGLGVAKPDPGFFAAVQQLVGTTDPRDVLYVGDRVDNDVAPAARHGMWTCWLQRGPWGQLQDLPDDLEPDLVLDGLGELPHLLTQWREDAG